MDGLFKRKKMTDCAEGSGGKCKPMGNARSGTYKSVEWNPGKMPKYSKREQEEMDKEAEDIVRKRKVKKYVSAGGGQNEPYNSTIDYKRKGLNKTTPTTKKWQSSIQQDTA